MRFDKAYSLSTSLVALSGLAALLITREAPDWLTVPAALLVLTGVISPRPRPLLSKSTVTALTFAAVGFAVVDFLYIGGSLITAGADLLVLLLLLKFFSLSSDGDYVQLYVISFFLLLASTGLSTDIYFVIPFLCFFVFLVWALMLLTIKSDSEGASGRPPRWGVGGSFFMGSGLLTVLSMAATIAIFLVIPRVGIGYFSKGVKGILKISGFSDTVELGSMGQVLSDPSIVMRVQAQDMEGKPGKPMYWRGRVFDYYDGRSWTDTLSGRAPLLRDAEGVFYIRLGKKTPKDSLVENITLEPMETDTVFAPYPAYEITGPFQGLFIDPSAALHFVYPPGGRVGYTVRAAAREPGPGELKTRPGGLPPGPAARKYLLLPKGSEALIKLAREVTSGEDTPYGKARKIDAYLGRNCSYTLSPHRNPAYSPMDDFLFHSKQGYCEHFATAMALMLRAVDVPARLVSGFMGGEWNAYGGYLLVRARDAHTWVEAYFPESGWVRFDPTPAAPAPPAQTLTGITNLIDFLEYRWDRYIVFYNLRDQIGAMRQAANAADKIKNGVSGILTAGPGGLLSFKGKGLYASARLILLSVAVLALLVYLAARLTRSRARDGGYAVPFYGEMVKILRKKGYVRRKGATPLEFARGISGDAEDLGGVIYITGLYNRVRFGGDDLSRDEKARADELVRGLKHIKNKEKQG